MRLWRQPIGTGTGWNAVVVAEAGAVVTTIGIDAEVADHPRAALARAGRLVVLGSIAVTASACRDARMASDARR
jgi:protein-L-isoaspartate O-methyltransferase